jgi:hypothetical protein
VEEKENIEQRIVWHIANNIQQLEALMLHILNLKLILSKRERNIIVYLSNIFAKKLIVDK